MISHTLLSTNATPLFDAAGRIDGMVVTVEDITERLTLEAQLRQSQKMESVGQLAAGVAHDINNILTVIQGHAGLLLNITPPDSSSVRSLKQISAASERAARFVRQLLTFSRKQIFRSKILDLNTVLQNLQNMLPQMLGEDIALETRYQPNLPHIEADTGMIEQIVMNLAVNARDAMPKGGKLLIATSAVEIGATHHAAASRSPAGLVRLFDGHGHRLRHGPQSLATAFRTLFYNQGRGQGDRAWVWPPSMAWSNNIRAGSKSKARLAPAAPSRSFCRWPAKPAMHPPRQPLNPSRSQGR